jgi:hypothetical protein
MLQEQHHAPVPVPYADPYRYAPLEHLFVMPKLPKEVLFRLLKFSIEGLSPSSRYRNLRAACLVGRTWRAPCQALLCRDVVIHSQGTATRWLAVSLRFS